MPEKQQRGEVGDLFLAVCPLSVPAQLGPHRPGPANPGIPDSAVARHRDH
jgi:hypothetical protein